MEKKEFKVGETFHCGLIKLKVEKEDEYSCSKCFFYKTWLCDNMNMITGSCFESEREDHTSVIFVKVDE